MSSEEELPSERYEKYENAAKKEKEAKYDEMRLKKLKDLGLIGNLLIDEKTGKPDRGMAGCISVFMIAGFALGQWYGVANDWRIVKRVLMFYVNFGFLLGGLGGAVLGFACCELFRKIRG